ncbi:necrosis inducing protein-domain-containing protein [Lasiosphaeria miniovina]|uniref:Necrosis inducing protein-domain-containing protein n=1 Tax=Lasiosphaeria miniovina TaxID=1954250 RepID=A0AA40AD88_9PEZI|nr:necrosis inducing protein-domain-containing protein [Lasiosphaeria miniovina]KAK0713723.1 necrosis inducing protein-domain-containing protein [Lasiosphaeria miniovina]
MITSLLVTALAGSALALPLLEPRAVNPPTALPQRATANDLRWQPSLDFDTDGCYNVPAIDASGNIVQGLPHQFVGTSSDCHDLSDLQNNNVYSRQRCNNGWCIYIYDYYFEKDVAVPYFIDVGHTHDWEHVAVWVKDGQGAQYVGASQHGNYEVRAAANVRWDGEHPKMVYHKDGASTHCFRFASAADEPVENALGVWFRGPLVSYNGFPAGIRDLLYAHDFGSANIALKDSSFPAQITSAKPAAIATFDPNLDVGSPGTPP